MNEIELLKEQNKTCDEYDKFLESFFPEKDKNVYFSYDNLLNTSFTVPWVNMFKPEYIKDCPYNVQDSFEILNSLMQELMNRRIKHDFYNNPDIDVDKYCNDLGYQYYKMKSNFKTITKYFNLPDDFYEEKLQNLDSNLENTVKSVSSLKELKSVVSVEDYNMYYEMFSKGENILLKRDEILDKYGIDIQLSNIGDFDIAYNLVNSTKGIVSDDDYKKCMDIVSSRKIDVKKAKDMIISISKKYPDFQFERKSSVFEEISDEEFYKRYNNEYKKAEYNNSELFEFIKKHINVNFEQNKTDLRLNLSSNVASKEEMLKSEKKREQSQKNIGDIEKDLPYKI